MLDFMEVFLHYFISLFNRFFVCTNQQYPCTLEREFLTSRQWGSLFTDNILADKEDHNDRQYMNTLWGFVIQKYADISIPHLEHITGRLRVSSLYILPLLLWHLVMLKIFRKKWYCNDLDLRNSACCIWGIYHSIVSDSSLKYQFIFCGNHKIRHA